MSQQQSDSFFFLFQEHDQPSWIVSLSDFAIQDVNKAALKIFKIRRPAFLKSSLEDLFPSDWSRIKRILQKKAKGYSSLGTLHYENKLHKTVLQKVKTKRIKFNNRPCCLITASVQVLPHKVNKKIESEFLMQKAKLRETEKDREKLLKRFEKISDSIPGFIYEFRMRKDGSVHFPFASKGIIQTYGITPEDIKNDASAMFSRIHPDDVAILQQELQNS